MADQAAPRIYRMPDDHGGSWLYYNGTANCAYDSIDSLLDDLGLDDLDGERLEAYVVALPVARALDYEVTPRRFNSMNNAGLTVQAVYDPVARHGCYHVVAIAVSDLEVEASREGVSWGELVKAARAAADEMQEMSDGDGGGDEDGDEDDEDEDDDEDDDEDSDEDEGEDGGDEDEGAGVRMAPISDIAAARLRGACATRTVTASREALEGASGRGDEDLAALIVDVGGAMAAEPRLLWATSLEALFELCCVKLPLALNEADDGETRAAMRTALDRALAIVMATDDGVTAAKLSALAEAIVPGPSTKVAWIGSLTELERGDGPMARGIRAAYRADQGGAEDNSGGSSPLDEEEIEDFEEQLAEPEVPDWFVESAY